MTRPRINRCRSGFSIIELMVVISIILLLISLLVPSFATIRDRARRLKWFGFSTELRAIEHYLIYFNMEERHAKTVDWGNTTAEQHPVELHSLRENLTYC